MPRVRSSLLVAAAAVMLLAPLTAGAQQGFIKCPPLGQPLLEVPEITRDAATKTLPAVMKVTDQDRIVWFNGPNDANGKPGPAFCAEQHMRFFQGYSPVPGHENEKWPATSGPAEPLPGPTFRARVGDTVMMTFFNQVDLTNFPNSEYWDRAERGLGTGCDEVAGIYPKGGTINDTFPNCFHGSSTANIHFHGTHTTPATTGDNVLIQIRPSLRTAPALVGSNTQPVVSEASVDFKQFFQDCKTQLATVPSSWPTKYADLPQAYRDSQLAWLTKYDEGVPEPHKLSPANERALKNGEWPQYYIGAYPYCFQLPEYKKKPADRSQLQMGQSPGTHWYHMHKHGSTTLNVANSLIGAFVIEGDYDDQLEAYYKNEGTRKNWGLDEKVLVIQQVGVTPNLERGPSQQSIAQLSVNGRRQPVIEMRAGQVQLWRVVNGAPRSGVYFNAPGKIQWAQTAQDGVQLNVLNYSFPAAGGASKPFLMSAGNRVDLLVKVPAGLAPGDYPVQVVDVVKPTEITNAPVTLLTVRVPKPDAAKDPSPEMPFITADKFPVQPEFLRDIDPDTIFLKRKLVFNSTGRALGANHTINGEKFADETINQVMLQNNNEEWTLVNTTSDAASPGPIMHPFHIHINPFQIFEVFDPYDPRYVFVESEFKKGTNCYVNPADKSTWKPCDVTKLKPPFVWWDVFGIPGGRQVPADTGVIIPGYFKMRSAFVDYAGQYVLHCHILAHEDRGMMQLIEVVPDRTTMQHH
ncbi:MAG TPA: multicopper oxidase domain-containing protein [Thermoanaerobaculia bacterium]|nr:multicopper oxidase domain-containing protein [Thermoanaerobaculia bacterium]